MKRLALAAFVTAALCAPATAQVEDEIIVTATRSSAARSAPIPGQYLVVPGDNLLLAVRVESDDRDAATRYREITDTIRAMLEQAVDEDDITISFVGEANSVRPLTPSLFEAAIGMGSRPDTSVAVLQVKTPIPDTVPDAFALSTRLQRFVDGVEERGRVTVEATNRVTVSVVNPRQYRPHVLALVTAEIRAVTDALGPEYRALLDGVDAPMRTFRAGDLSLGFYLPYEYQIVPDTLHSIRIVDEDY